jgi:hypothetical protein
VSGMRVLMTRFFFFWEVSYPYIRVLLPVVGRGQCCWYTRSVGALLLVVGQCCWLGHRVIPMSYSAWLPPPVAGINQTWCSANVVSGSDIYCCPRQYPISPATSPPCCVGKRDCFSLPSSAC